MLIIWFILLQPMGDNSKEGMLILIPLAVTDASIVWWISFERIFLFEI